MRKIETSEDIDELMWGYACSVAINLALEKGLFWELLDHGKTENGIADLYSIPLNRCTSWLRLLTKLGLLEKDSDYYLTSPISITVITNKYSRETWNLLAREVREQYQAIIELNDHIIHPKSVWSSQGIENLSYVTKMQQSPDRAEQFTRMLFEIHQPLAD
ncbi:MAG: hypothetical protein ACW99Q_26435, partial [Candidatus Kariarchaeaceae archaeon]